MVDNTNIGRFARDFEDTFDTVEDDMENRFDTFEDRFDTVEDDTENRFDTFEDRFDTLENDTENRFDTLEDTGNGFMPFDLSMFNPYNPFQNTYNPDTVNAYANLRRLDNRIEQQVQDRRMDLFEDIRTDPFSFNRDGIPEFVNLTRINIMESISGLSDFISRPPAA